MLKRRRNNHWKVTECGIQGERIIKSVPSFCRENKLKEMDITRYVAGKTLEWSKTAIKELLQKETVNKRPIVWDYLILFFWISSHDGRSGNWQLKDFCTPPMVAPVYFFVFFIIIASLHLQKICQCKLIMGGIPSWWFCALFVFYARQYYFKLMLLIYIWQKFLSKKQWHDGKLFREVSV